MQPPFWVHEKVWNDCFMAIILVFFDSKTPNKTFIKVGTPSLIKHRFVWICYSAKRKFQGDIFLPIGASQDFSGFRSRCSTTKKLLRCSLPHLEYHGQCKSLSNQKVSCIQAKAICHCSEYWHPLNWLTWNGITWLAPHKLMANTVCIICYFSPSFDWSMEF